MLRIICKIIFKKIAKNSQNSAKIEVAETLVPQRKGQLAIHENTYMFSCTCFRGLLFLKIYVILNM